MNLFLCVTSASAVSSVVSLMNQAFTTGAQRLNKYGTAFSKKSFQELR
jgi:hypothetical protein